MKQIKLNFLAIVALGGLTICAPIVRADDAPKPATPPAAGQSGQRGAGMQKVIDSLNLTDEQKPQFMTVIKERREKMNALRDDTAVTGDDRKAKMKEIMAASNAKIKGILTPEQFTKWEDAQKNMRQNRPGGNAPAANAPATQPDLPTK